MIKACFVFVNKVDVGLCVCVLCSSRVIEIASVFLYVCDVGLRGCFSCLGPVPCVFQYFSRGKVKTFCGFVYKVGTGLRG